MKKQSLLALGAIALTASAALASCGGSGSPFEKVEKDAFKIGLITLHGEESTYDKNFIDSMKRAVANCGLSETQLEIATNVPETSACKDKAVELAQTCNVVFADSFSHEDYMIEAAMANPTVRFAHATGTKAHTVKLNNFSNAFASIYEGRYLAGVAAGLKLKEMKEAGQLNGTSPKIGYVGAFNYAEVISGYTSFFLGARSVVEDVTMDVKYTSSWFDLQAEKDSATALIAAGCDLISQHADSMGAPEACENAGVPNVTYNGSTGTECPNTYLVSSKIDWAPYFEHIIQCTLDGKKIEHDWSGNLSSGSVKLDAVGGVAAANTQATLDTVAAKIKSGELHVFDTSKFTVGGETLTSYLADVDTDPNWEKDTEVVKDGYFHESEYRSAPYFDIIIDGIREL